MIEKEKGIDKEIIFEAIEASLVSACKKNFGSNQNIKVVIDRETGNVACYAQREVVEEVMDEQNEIDLMAARILNPSYQIGDTVDLEVTPRDFGRVAAQTAKQVVVQKFREAEREILYNQYITCLLYTSPEERKLQRLFRNAEASRLIKRCNDFGAGGVSVAIGELADGLEINLNAVPKKYEGLDGTELALSLIHI